MQVLEEVYKSLLASMDVVVDEDGLASLRHPDDRLDPIMCEGKRMVLPTHEVLRNPNWESTIAFHPLSESVTTDGESPILKKLRTLISYRLTSVSSVLMESLMRIAVEKEGHSKITPKQVDLLEHLNAAIPASYKATIKVLEKVSLKNPLLSIYLKRGGKWRGNKYARVAITRFPFLDEFKDDGDKTVFGVEVAKRDKALLKELFTYIFEDCEDGDNYSFGSNDLSAPYFHALMNAYLIMAKRLNKVTRKFKSLLDNPELLLIDTEWEGFLNDLHLYRDKIPPLVGNEGGVVSKEAQAEAIERGQFNPQALRESLQEDDYVEPVRLTNNQSGYQRQPEPVPEATRPQAMSHAEESSGSSPFRQFGSNAPAPRAEPQPQYVQQAPQYAPPPQPQYAPQSSGQPYPAHRPPQEAPPAPVDTGRGLDWKSVVASNVGVQRELGAAMYNNPNMAEVMHNDPYVQHYQQLQHQQGFGQPQYGPPPVTRGGYPQAPVMGSRGGYGPQYPQQSYNQYPQPPATRGGYAPQQPQYAQQYQPQGYNPMHQGYRR